jgi:manganese/zinc/iron transport system substrate-binding protein
MMKMKYTYLIILPMILAMACKRPAGTEKHDKLNAVATTSLITEVIREIGGDALEVAGLMGAGVDPHLYKASEGDVNTLFNADIVFYNGLHLEGKMQDIFEKMKGQGMKIFAVSDTLNKAALISSANFASSYDPHIWFDVANWKLVADFIARQLSRADRPNEELYMENARKYIMRLDSTERAILAKINELPQEKRILITAHDAFNYFGRAYGVEVLGLQGISTASEAGVQDVQYLAAFIISRNIKAIFVESSVPLRNIEALREAVKSKGYQVEIGGSLYSDALGNPGTPEGTYTGMFLYNVNTIVDALKD